ncbi:Glyco_hydro_35 domain-containing protein/Gal_Lectin domain-containing protein [Cephalotus follicularis]|uniref:Beta-galactosidase n=1 Tax=Cephalotus follicularis TaxID=3775 RepID=A0A1Q3BJI3_CEPFO|nr:Glyco_hydro_35 domain-containing protein/Gal_Lectin domain-containing protein [Cephalotus follicularis]
MEKTNSKSMFLLLLSGAILLFGLPSFAIDVSHDDRAITINGERRIILSGSIHYPRSTPEMWPSLVRKSKEGGLNTIETYVFWNAHEPLRRQYDFSGNLDLVRFIKSIQSEGLYAILRIGPYVCAEWDYGGFPVWLHNMPGVKFRTKNTVFQNEMQIFTTLIVDMMKRENLFASQGGPIILAQIENEYGNVMWSYGNDGVEYINWCAKMANDLNIGVPWIMCQQSNAPQPMLQTCNGFYCDQYTPKSNSTPKMWTENWTGWYKDWGGANPHRTAEDLAFSVARFYQRGGSMSNYYMYHGGTNFGRTAGGPYITTSYDYDAPLDEYGNLNQPKWGHLKQLHGVLISLEKVLTYGSTRQIDYNDKLAATVYTYEGQSACFFSNWNWTNDLTLEYEQTQYTIPAWSVSILPDCYTEVYNTAKLAKNIKNLFVFWQVNAQTSIMVKKPNDADDQKEPYELQWVWRSEHFENFKNGIVQGSVMSANELLDQKAVANDTSDYMWYMTSVDIDESDPVYGEEAILHVHTNGHIVHAFVNGKHIGSQYAPNGHWEFIFEKYFKLRKGINQISLLSVTVGLPNYGANFDTARNGIRGPVKLIGGVKNVTKDISSNKWINKVGLHGEEKKLYEVDTHYARKWHAENLPSHKMFVWYKTSFQAPLGRDPVVVDLLGLGKGYAWVNGHNIGRYWPSYLAGEHGCSYTCDYRGNYDGNKKCLTGCGEPSQRWYHIPREYLKDDDNVLVLFEEFGGTPENVNFQTVTVGKACANAYEGNVLELSCQGERVISEIKFASFGEPQGTCGSFRKGGCEAKNTLQVVQKECLGKQSCSLDISEDTFGPTHCKGGTYRLAVEAIC